MLRVLSSKLADDMAGGNVSCGDNLMTKLRSHSQDFWTAARQKGIAIPRSPGNPAMQSAMTGYIESIVQNPAQFGIGQYKQYANAIWSERAGLIVVRQSNGQFVTVLRAGERAATNAPF
jgi:hypothetical protein